MRAILVSNAALGFAAVAACTTPMSVAPLTASQLAGSWRVISVNGGGAEPGQVTLEFNADGRAAGNASCNNYSAAYTLDGSKLTFGQAVATRKACEERSMEMEQRFLATLGDVERGEIAPGGDLVLYARGEDRIVARRN